MKADLLNAVKSKDKIENTDALVEVRNMARSLRDLALQIKDLEEQVAEKKKLQTQLQMKDLPELFEQHRIRSIGLEAEGNLPAYEVTSRPYYHAVLPKEEDEGLRWLEDNGHGDMIRRAYTVNLGKDSEKLASMLREFLQDHDLAYEEKETVPWTTLTAFVKEQIEKRKTTPPLDILGAIVGRKVEIKPKR